jgi:hypothetical protein
LVIRLKKALKVKNELTKQMVDKIDSSSLKDLKILLEKYNLDSKTHITKTDMIEIIIKNVDKNKVSEIAKVEEIIIDEPNEVVPVVEEVAPVVEEVVAPAPVVVQEVVANPQNEDLMKIIIQNQEIIMKQYEMMNQNDKEDSPNTYTKVFNIILVVLIVIVSIIWILYGVNFLSN